MPTLRRLEYSEGGDIAIDLDEFVRFYAATASETSLTLEAQRVERYTLFDGDYEGWVYLNVWRRNEAGDLTYFKTPALLLPIAELIAALQYLQAGELGRRAIELEHPELRPTTVVSEGA